MRVGSFDTQEAYILHGDNWGGFDIATALEYRRTDGFKENIEVDVQSYYDNIFGTNASRAPGPVDMQRRNFDARLDISKGHWRLRTGYQGRRDMGTGGNLGLADPDGHYEDDRFNADLTYQNPNFTKYWDVTAQLSYYQTAYITVNQTLFPPGAFGGAYPNGMILDSGIDERHTRMNLSGFYAGFKEHLIRLGVGYHYGDLYNVKHTTNTDPITGLPLPYQMDISDTPYAWIPEGDRHDWYLFLQDAWVFAENWELTAGLRYDNYSDFGSTTNPRMALVWQPSPRLTAKLMYGSAFRAPMFFELYAQNNPVTMGNSNLDPETIKTWELAFDYRATDNFHLATNFFTYKWSDGIRYVHDSAV